MTLRITSIFLFLILLLTRDGNAQPLRWEEGGIIQNQNVYCFALAPNGEMYFQVPEGVHRRSRDGTTITLLYTESGTLINLIAGPTGRIAGYTYNYVYFSNNANDSLLYCETLNTIYFSTASPDSTFYFITSSNRIFRTQNFGATWNFVATPCATTDIRGFLSSSEGHLFIVTQTNGVFVSSDRGANWSGVNAGLEPSVWVQCIAKAPNGKIYIGTHAHGVLTWNTHSHVWESCNAGIPFMDIRCVAANSNGDLLISGNGAGVFLYNSILLRWYHCGFSDVTTSRLGFLADGELLVNLTTGGAYYSSNRGYDWFGIGNSTIVQNLTSVGDTIIASNQALFRSTNHGETWARRIEGITEHTVYAYPLCRTNANTLLAAPSEQIFRSTNSGSYWQAIAPVPFTTVLIRAFAIKPESNVILAFSDEAGNTHILRSLDDGLTWQLTQEIASCIPFTITWVDSTRWMLATNLGVYVSQNDGSSFSPAGANPRNSLIRAFARYADSTVFGGNEYGVFKTSDWGVSWTECDRYTLNDRILSLKFLSNGYLLAGTYTRGVFLSTNFGDSWTSQNDGLMTYRVNAFTQSEDGTLYAGTIRGVYRCENFTSIYDTKPNCQLPQRVTLQSVYPNPFNSSTTIRYSLPTAGYVQVDVVDLLGRTVLNLTHGNQTIGNHEIEFSGKQLSSGVYFIRLLANDQQQIQKVVHLP